MGALVLLLAWFISPYFLQPQNRSISSPLPDFLSIPTNKQVTSLDLWVPAALSFRQSFLKDPKIEAKSVLMYDLTLDKVLYEKNAEDKLPMASLTKIMTAIIAIENRKDDNEYTVYKNNLVGEDSMGLSSGESLSLEELLYGLMLPSGNDAAEVLATNFHLGRDGFIVAMNNKATALGLKNTHYTNPSGLQGDGDQHTTVYDLLVVTRYAISKFPELKTIVSTFEYTIPQTTTHKEYFLQNETNLLTTYPGVKGVKTGYTPEAGLCLITYLEYKDHKIIGILLGSENRRREMKDLLDYSLKSLGITPPKTDI